MSESDSDLESGSDSGVGLGLGLGLTACAAGERVKHASAMINKPYRTGDRVIEFLTSV